MKKRIVFIALAALMVLGLCACSKPYNYKFTDYFDLPQYKGIEYSASAIQKSVDSAVDSYITGKATETKITEEERGANDGDRVNIDFVGYMDGNTFDGGTGEGQDVVIGEGRMIEGFEDGIKGHKVGEKFTLDLKFPDPYLLNSEYSGKDVSFDITINSITQIDKPELTDELVAADGVYKTVDEYKSALKEQYIKDSVWGTVYNSVKFKKYPEKEIKKYYQTMLSNYQNMAINYGVSFDVFATSNGYTDANAFCNYIASTATEQAKQEMVMWSILRNEGIEYTKDEYNDFVEKYASQAGMSAKDFVSQYGKSSIEQSVYTEKLLDFLMENAVEKE